MEKMDSKQSSSTIKILMFPWLAHGHISPFLELAKKLTARNFQIYLCSTPINLSSIQNKITNKTHSISIKLVPLHIPPSMELPPHLHTTNGLPPHLLPALKKIFEMASPDFSRILQTLSPDLVIYDIMQPWAPTIASEFKIPAVEFVTSGAAIFSFYLHMLVKPGVEMPFPEHQRILEEFRNKQPRETLVTVDEHDKTLFLDGIKGSCKMILFKTFIELEGKYIDYFSVLAEKKVVPVGHLVQETDDENKDSEIIQWLGTKDGQSTVFVSFGSESFLSKEETVEIAHGLELSGVNFIWVVRFPVGERIEVAEALPVGFLDRIGERGLVVEGWAPQAQILAHSNTGGFVSHCGWNSILESLKFGVPIIAMPMNHDQPFNAKMVEEVGVGLKVKRDENRRVNRENIAQVIRNVVKGESGVDIRSKAREFCKIIRKKGEEEIDGLVEELVQLCNKGK